jgi:hypothetical protein
MPLVEPDDMTMVASPCHGFEPVKVADDWAEPLYCLVCGRPFGSNAVQSFMSLER